MFEFLQLTRMCMYSFIRSFAHLFDHSKCVLYDDVYACASCVCTFVPPHVYNNYRRLYSLIGSCPGFLLPCFLLCISNYEGEFLGTDDSNCLVRLNFELKSEYLASATIPPPSPLTECIPFHFALIGQHYSLFIFHAQFSGEKRLNI